MKLLRAILVVTIVALSALVADSVRHTPGRVAVVKAPVWTPITQQRLSHGRFKDLIVYAPTPRPRGVVLLLSGTDGWSTAMAEIADRLAQQGAMVVGIDVAQFNAVLENDGGQCVYPDGDLENLSHFIQAYFRLPTYLSPILAGYSAGATLAYATLVQSPANTFAAAVSMDFCPGYALRKPLCKGSGIDFTAQPHDKGVDFLPAPHLANPWVVLQSGDHPACDASTVRRFVAQIPGAQFIAVADAGPRTSVGSTWVPLYAGAFDTLIAAHAPAAAASTPTALSDLPIVPVAPQPGIPPSDTFAILLSGDGGWAGLDKEVADALAAKGIFVVGLDSLRYFWSPRTPAGLAADLDRMIHYYSSELGKQRVMLVGYSQGADVLPFAVNRLPAATRARVALAAIMGMSEHALFEFHMSSWIADDNSGPATMPEVARIAGIPVLCIYGEQESDSLCPQLDPHTVAIVKLKGGHHFDGDYAALAQTILAAAHR